MASPQTITFSALLKHYRMAAGLTQEELAEKAGLSAGAVSTLERCISRAPRRDTIALLADALGLAPSERGRFERAAHDWLAEALANRSAAEALSDLHTAKTTPGAFVRLQWIALVAIAFGQAVVDHITYSVSPGGNVDAPAAPPAAGA